tara:strand:- start:4212 stop:4922 length:711 start_codon:yes stop_codon:yes gene_type:complete
MTTKLDMPERLLISMDDARGLERRKLLNYDDYTLSKGVDYEHTSDFVKNTMYRRYNESDDSSQWKAKCGIFQAHINALQYIVDKKKDNVIILEDDSFYEPPECVILPEDAPCLLNGKLCHPTAWKKNIEFVKDKVDDILNTFTSSLHEIDYDTYRWSGAFAIYYPKWENARSILDFIYKSGKKLTHFDIYLAKNRLVKYLHYPSIYTHDDTLTKGKCGGYEGFIKNYKINDTHITS